MIPPHYSFSSQTESREDWKTICVSSETACTISSLSPSNPYKIRIQAWSLIGKSGEDIILQILWILVRLELYHSLHFPLFHYLHLIHQLLFLNNNLFLLLPLAFCLFHTLLWGCFHLLVDLFLLPGADIDHHSGHSCSPHSAQQVQRHQLSHFLLHSEQHKSDQQQQQ